MLSQEPNQASMTLAHHRLNDDDGRGSADVVVRHSGHEDKDEDLSSTKKWNVKTWIMHSLKEMVVFFSISNHSELQK